MICNEPIVDVSKLEFINAPKYLVFTIKDVIPASIENPKDILMCSELKFKVGQTNHRYELKSHGFQISNDVQKPLRDTKPQDDDSQDGTHTCVMIKTNDEWKEIDNNKVLEPLRVYKTIKQRMLIFYRRID